MNEKPFRLDMGFNEALRRLSRVPKEQKQQQPLDYEKRDGRNAASRGKKPRPAANLMARSRKGGKGY